MIDNLKNITTVSALTAMVGFGFMGNAVAEGNATNTSTNKASVTSTATSTPSTTPTFTPVDPTKYPNAKDDAIKVKLIGSTTFNILSNDYSPSGEKWNSVDFGVGTFDLDMGDFHFSKTITTSKGTYVINKDFTVTFTPNKLFIKEAKDNVHYYALNSNGNVAEADIYVVGNKVITKTTSNKIVPKKNSPVIHRVKSNSAKKSVVASVPGASHNKSVLGPMVQTDYVK